MHGELNKGSQMDAKDYGKLMRGVIRNVNAYIGSEIAKYGVKEGQYEYFLHIYYSPGINQLELAKLKNVGKGSVTKAVKIPEEEGNINRVVEEKDRRNILCYVNEKGKEIVHDLIEVRIKSEETLFKGMSIEDRKIFYKYLNILYKNSSELLEQ